MQSTFVSLSSLINWSKKIRRLSLGIFKSNRLILFMNPYFIQSHLHSAGLPLSSIFSSIQVLALLVAEETYPFLITIVYTVHIKRRWNLHGLIHIIIWQIQSISLNISCRSWYRSYRIMQMYYLHKKAILLMKRYLKYLLKNRAISLILSRAYRPILSVSRFTILVFDGSLRRFNIANVYQ